MALSNPLKSAIMEISELPHAGNSSNDNVSVENESHNNLFPINEKEGNLVGKHINKEKSSIIKDINLEEKKCQENQSIITSKTDNLNFPPLPLNKEKVSNQVKTTNLERRESYLNKNTNSNNRKSSTTYARTVVQHVLDTEDNVNLSSEALSEVFNLDEDNEQAMDIANSANCTKISSDLYDQYTSKLNAVINQNVFKTFKKFYNEKSLVITVTNAESELSRFPIDNFYHLLTEKNLWTYISKILVHPNNTYLCIDFYNLSQKEYFRKNIRYLNDRIICYIDLERPLVLNGQIRNCYIDFTEMDLQVLLKKYGVVSNFNYLLEKRAPIPVLTNTATFNLTLNKNINPENIPTLHAVDISPLLVTFRGISPECFFCKERSHLIKDCPNKFCRDCGFKITKLHRCAYKTQEGAKLPLTNSEKKKDLLLQKEIIIPANMSINKNTFLTDLNEQNSSNAKLIITNTESENDTMISLSQSENQDNSTEDDATFQVANRKKIRKKKRSDNNASSKSTGEQMEIENNISIIKTMKSNIKPKSSGIPVNKKLKTSASTESTISSDNPYWTRQTTSNYAALTPEQKNLALGVEGHKRNTKKNKNKSDSLNNTEIENKIQQEIQQLDYDPNYDN